MKALIFILALMPAISHAQSLRERLTNAPEISFADWKDMTAGKTVVYEIDGETFGYETYRGGGNVTIRLDDGSCIDGTWFMQQNQFCFNWQDGPLNCFHHKRLDGTIYVIGLDGGVETDDIQRVSRIARIPLACGPALLSSLAPEAQP